MQKVSWEREPGKEETLTQSETHRRHGWVRTGAILALAAVAAFAVACGGGGGQEGGGEEPVKIGLLATLDGPFAAFGEEAYRGAKLALLEHGGKLEGTAPRDGVSGAEVAGRPIELSYESSDGTPDVALEAMRRLVEQEGVDIAVGPLSGDEGLAIKDYAKTQPDVTFLNGTSAAVQTTLEDPAPNFFRFTTDGAQWMAGLGPYVYEELGYRRVATLAEDYSYPYSQVGAFQLQFCDAGGEVTEKIWVPLGTKDYASFIQQIPENIDALYVALGGSDTVNFVKQYDEFTGGEVPIIAGSSTIDQSTLQQLGDRMVGVPSAAPVGGALDTEGWKEFADAYTENFPDALPAPSLFAWGYYVNMKAALQGLAEAEGDLSGSHETYNEALSNLTLESPTGPIKLDENRQAIAPNYVFEVAKRDGTLVNEPVKKIDEVDQTLGLGVEEYRSLAPYERDFTCR